MTDALRTLAAAALLLLPLQARAEVITVLWTASALTVVNKPFGLTVPYATPVAGYFTFDTLTEDSDDSPVRGAYQHAGNAGFRAEVLGHEVTGSLTPFYEVDLDADPTLDTFRIVDGPRTVGSEGGVMAFDGTEDSSIQLSVALTEDVFTDDALKDPFPLYDFGFLGTPHTFSLKNSQGTMLMQIDSVAEAVCGDPNGGGVKSSDALFTLRASVGTAECLPCVCDADGNGKLTATDALRVLRFAVGGGAAPACSACL